ncbi:tripartite ATP-independent transporter DctM subunit [Sinobacterium caligoides]|uniref:TRAP transporter large permease protein n=1 Tax=Sinobacterium caligoides TaxID=933926 RepID=A0A3N2DNX9_9GAMM|nr:TRAP transporter large permease subunit [Sinobacterium caligoides]ROS01490.1 tripartite ATP-independent transporter DctM subunit [Sinobacterium caligoides]
MTTLMFAAIFVMAVSGAPIFAVILAASMLGFYIADVPLTVIGIELYRISETPLLLALPLFTLSGYLMAESQTSQRMVRLTQALFGWLPGGLSIIALIVCALFTAFTGASGVTIVAVGALLYPALKQVGYSEKFGLGLVTTSGSLGLLLAPSLPLILYGIIAQQMNLDNPFTIKDLFLAGIFPALLMISLLAFYSLWSNRNRPIAMQSFDLQELKSALWQSRWELPMPLFVIGGIYGGYFAVSEMAAVIVLYVLLVEVVLYREIPLRRLPQIIRQAMTMVGGIILILAVSLALTGVLIDAEIPTRIFEVIKSHVDSKYTFLILLNIFLLLLGAVLDIFSAIVIMVPIILPVAISYGIDPVHLGIIFLANMQIGYFTPPVGMNLFIASYRFNKPVTELYSAALPFMAVLIFALLLITYIPAITLALL